MLYIPDCEVFIEFKHSSDYIWLELAVLPAWLCSSGFHDITMGYRRQYPSNCHQQASMSVVVHPGVVLSSSL